MKPIILTSIFLLITCSTFAQTITGEITNNNKKRIAEANILNTSTDNHVHSDENGSFTLKDASIGDILKISYTGYESQFIPIKSLNQSLKIVLNNKNFTIDEITVTPRINALNEMIKVDVQKNPVNSSQDLLRKTPGLFIGQHAGGGKAEQIFLRGFDIDHGTDINISVDGMPVNMVSHAHGQGYADLHFVIPETINTIDFGKGPYYENKGNFTTAGYVDFSTKNRLNNSSIKLEAGQFDTYRLLGMFNLVNNSKQSAYVATEHLSTDGYFDSSQNFNRTNILGKYTANVNQTDQIAATVSHFNSQWDASGQIPTRAIKSGLINRFGAIDNTEGGNTSRTNVLVNYNKTIDEKSRLKNSLFLNQYDFELYSNFTFFLDDAINGDQIKQKENRTIYGFNSEYDRAFSTAKIEGAWQAGISLRNDKSKDNELSHTKNRSETLNPIQLGDINETNLGAYTGATIDINKFTINPSLRIDYFDYQYNDKLATTYKTQENSKAIVSPKLNVLYNPTNNLQLYIKSGKGFHSNDTRVVLNNQADKILPAAYGFDAGTIWKPTNKMLLNIAYWNLYLEQEFVYVGDAGIVEPSGKTKRQGIDVSYRYQPMNWLYWNTDITYTHARATEETKGEDYIPLAPDFTLTSGANIRLESGIYGGVNVRHIGDRPANEDNSILAEGYTVTDLNAGYKFNQFNLGFQIQNLFDTDWNEAQFATESRLSFEPNSVEEIHFTPGTPFFIKGIVEYNF